jgi:hypothetical protein
LRRRSLELGIFAATNILQVKSQVTLHDSKTLIKFHKQFFTEIGSRKSFM